MESGDVDDGGMRAADGRFGDNENQYAEINQESNIASFRQRLKDQRRPMNDTWRGGALELTGNNLYNKGDNNNNNTTAISLQTDENGMATDRQLIFGHGGHVGREDSARQIFGQ